MPNRTETLVLERCLRILRFLLTHQRATIHDLYHLFQGGVSIRTLERDMVRLSGANVPLDTFYENGREQVWKFSSRFRDYIPQLLCDEEILAVLLVEELAKVVAHTPWEEGVQQLRSRMKELCPVNVLDAQRSPLSNTFHLAQFGQVDLRPFDKQIRCFTEAVKRSIRIRIHYRKPTVAIPRIYEAEPYGVLLYREALYGVVLDVKGSRFLTLPFHRMEDVELLPTQPFHRRKDFQLSQFLSGRMGILGAQHQKTEKVVMRFYPPVAQVIAEREWHPSQVIEEENENTTLLTLHVQVTEELVAWILRYQKFVEVMRPQTLRDWVTQALKETLGRYE